MKTLKTLIALLLLVGAGLLALSSCSNDNGDYDNNVYVQFATLSKKAQAYYLTFDDDDTPYLVTDSALIVYQQINKKPMPQRVLAAYNKADLVNQPTPSVTLRDLMGILTKSFSPAPQNQEESDKLGHDIIRVNRAWWAAGYLNVEFYLPVSDVQVPHLISVYNTGETDTDGSYILEMRHNANGVPATYWSGRSYASFVIPYAAVDNKQHSYKLRYLYDNGQVRIIPIETYWECTAQQ